MKRGPGILKEAAVLSKSVAMLLKTEAVVDNLRVKLLKEGAVLK